MSNQDRETLDAELTKHYDWYNSGTRMWSTLHHTTLFLVPILTAVATVLLKAEWDWASDNVQIILTTAATVLASIAASQGFAKKWQTNRMSRSQIDQIRVEMTDPNVDLKTIRAKLLEIIRQHDEGVLAAENASAALPASKRKKS